LERAKNNLLKRYEAYGLKERFRESAHIFTSHLGREPTLSGERRKKTNDRPAKADLEKETLHKLRDLNSVDVALYEFACNHFESQKQKRKA
jgi:hypothetical protein